MEGEHSQRQTDLHFDIKAYCDDDNSLSKSPKCFPTSQPMNTYISSSKNLYQVCVKNSFIVRNAVHTNTNSWY
jgi:hypothetical protein